MDHLWAPWRIKYISGLHKKQSGCVFCKILRANNDKKNYIFKRSRRVFAVLNIYPYNNGHSLIVPNRHVSSLVKLTKEEREDFFEVLDETQKVLDKVLRPRGYNIGMNIGRVAGAGFPGHLHIHIVPRWAGDVNFMPVTGNTKIVSQSLSALFDKIKRCSHEKK